MVQSLMCGVSICYLDLEHTNLWGRLSIGRLVFWRHFADTLIILLQSDELSLFFFSSRTVACPKREHTNTKQTRTRIKRNTARLLTTAIKVPTNWNGVRWTSCSCTTIVFDRDARRNTIKSIDSLRQRDVELTLHRDVVADDDDEMIWDYCQALYMIVLSYYQCWKMLNTFVHEHEYGRALVPQTIPISICGV